MLLNYVIEETLTSTAFVAKVGKPPHVPEAHGVADARQHELDLVGPERPPRLQVVVGLLLLLLAAFVRSRVLIGRPVNNINYCLVYIQLQR